MNWETLSNMIELDTFYIKRITRGSLEFKTMFEAASAGSMEAQFYMGMWNQCVAEDDLSAYNWFQKAANQGYPSAVKLLEEQGVNKTQNISGYEQSTPDHVGASSAGTVYGNVSNASTIYNQEVFNARQGHGYAAEQAEHLFDYITGKNVSLEGVDLAKNGADRLVNGTQIQTKYCETGTKCVSECFKDGRFRYMGADNQPMQIEVPSDKYDEAVRAMENRIKKGEVPGVVDPAEAKNIIKKGHFTYVQAKNIAKAGTVESITFDAVNGAIVATSALGLSATLAFATSIWSGDDFDIAIRSSVHTGLKVGGTTFVTSIVAGQLTKAGMNSALVASSESVIRVLGPKGSALLVNAFRSGKNIYGAAAMKSAAKMLRTNVITSVASVVVLSTFDIANIFSGRISAKQLFKNVTGTVASVAGGTAGWIGGAAAGAAVGSVIPVIGTGIGGLIGGFAGSFLGGSVSGKATDVVLSTFIEDDAEEMVQIIQRRFEIMANDYLLTQTEATRIVDALGNCLDGGTLKDMYASSSRTRFADNLLVGLVENETAKRPKVKLPSLDQMQNILREVLEDIVDNAEDNSEISEDVNTYHKCIIEDGLNNQVIGEKEEPVSNTILDELQKCKGVVVKQVQTSLDARKEVNEGFLNILKKDYSGSLQFTKSVTAKDDSVFLKALKNDL